MIISDRVSRQIQFLLAIIDELQLLGFGSSPQASSNLPPQHGRFGHSIANGISTDPVLPLLTSIFEARRRPPKTMTWTIESRDAGRTVITEKRAIWCNRSVPWIGYRGDHHRSCCPDRVVSMFPPVPIGDLGRRTRKQCYATWLD